MGGGGGGGVEGVLETLSPLATPHPHRILKTFLMSSKTATLQACLAYHAHYICEMCMDTLDAVQHYTSPYPHAPYSEKKAPPRPICLGEDFEKKKEGTKFIQFQHSLQPALFSLVQEKKKTKEERETISSSPPFPIGHFTLTQFLFGPSSRGLCSQACFQPRQNNTVLSYIKKI